MTILIADDATDNRVALSLLLEDIDGIETIEASNGQDAVDICKCMTVDLVLMDIMMPIMDGIEATRQISTLKKKPIIIAVSALDDDEKQRQMIKAGAQDYFTKPINDEVFIARMHNYIKIISSMNERDLKHEWAINPFSKKVFAKKLLFRITNESSLGELWETFLLSNSKVTDTMSDCIRAIYTAGTQLLKTHFMFDIIVEENENHFYFTFTKIENYNKDLISKIVKKDYPGGFAKYGTVAFCLLLNKEPTQKEQNTIQTKQHIQVEQKTQTQEVKQPEIQLHATEQKEEHISEPREHETKTLNEHQEKLLRVTTTDKISAQEYINQLELNFFDKIDSLVEKEDSIDATLFELETSGKINFVSDISESLKEYVLVIDSLHEFQKISYSLNKLSIFLDTLTSIDLDEKKLGKLTFLIKSLLSDLTDWRKNIFSDKIAQDIHYLDSSLISSCIQIENIFTEVEAISDDDELELF